MESGISEKHAAATEQGHAASGERRRGEAKTFKQEEMSRATLAKYRLEAFSEDRQAKLMAARRRWAGGVSTHPGTTAFGATAVDWAIGLRIGS